MRNSIIRHSFLFIFPFNSKLVCRMCVWTCLFFFLSFAVAFHIPTSFLFSPRIHISYGKLITVGNTSCFFCFLLSDCISWYCAFGEWIIFEMISHGQIFSSVGIDKNCNNYHFELVLKESKLEFNLFVNSWNCRNVVYVWRSVEKKRRRRWRRWWWWRKKKHHLGTISFMSMIRCAHRLCRWSLWFHLIISRGGYSLLVWHDCF